MSASILVIGAGIGGLCTALSLAPDGHHITLLERDGAPPSADPDQAFQDWRRTGAGHIRQSHAFLARLRNIIKDKHPRLLEDLLSNGVREITFDMMLTDLQRPNYEPYPEDQDLTIITSRRTTLELIMRRYVECLDNVALRTGVNVKALKTARESDGTIHVLGVEADEQGSSVEIDADSIVDASGKSGFILQHLMEQGATIREDSESAGILYFTRHYRLKPGKEEPSRTDNPPASGDLGYLKFGVFPGDNGCFSITIAVPEIEYEMRKAILNPDIFHGITLMLPGLEPWTNSDRSEPRGKVYGMGDLHSRWRYMCTDDVPAVRNYFPLGDTLVRTNPLYGRGCSFAAVSAEALRETLQEESCPLERQRRYHTRLHDELRPYYDLQLKQDRSAIKRARRTLSPEHRKSLKARLAEGFIEDGVNVAVRSDIRLLREALRGFHMLEHPNKWLERPGNLAKVLGYWIRGKKRNAAAYPPKAGPERADLMARLGLDPNADLILPQQGSGKVAQFAAAE